MYVKNEKKQNLLEIFIYDVIFFNYVVFLSENAYALLTACCLTKCLLAYR